MPTYKLGPLDSTQHYREVLCEQCEAELSNLVDEREALTSLTAKEVIDKWAYTSGAILHHEQNCPRRS